MDEGSTGAGGTLWQGEFHPAPDRGRRAVLVASAAGAVSLALILLGLQWFAPSGPPTRSTGMVWGTGGGAATGLLILLVAGLTAWGVTAHHRCSDAIIRRYLVIATGLSVGWFILVLVKYPTQSAVLTELTWYLFYLPILFSPLLALYGVLRAATVDRGRAVRVLKRVAFVICAGFAALVLTNGLHFAVFRFDPAVPNFSTNYGYGPGYWALAGWVLTMFATAGAVLLGTARRQLRAATGLLFILVALGVVYSLLYVNRVHTVFTSNLALVYVTIFVIATEISLRLGLLPSYAWDREAFHKLPLDLWVLTRQRRPVYATHGAGLLSPAAADAVAGVQPPHQGAASFRTPGEPDLMYRVYGLRGGMALLAADISGVNTRRRLLESNRERLQRQNLLLAQDQFVQGRLQRLAHERRLLDEVESSLSSTADDIRRMLAELPSGGTAEAGAERRRSLTVIKLLVAYCKLKGNLVVAEVGGDRFDAERLRLIFAQAVTDLRTAGVACAATLDINGSLPSVATGLLFDCFYDVALSSFFCGRPVVMLHVGDRPDGAVELRIRHECEDEVDCGVAHHCLPDDLRNLLAGHDVSYERSGFPGSVSIKAVVGAEGS